MDLHRLNPWWSGGSMRLLPDTRRHLVEQIKRRFTYKLAPIVVVRGSRQIGKTTAYEQIIEDFLQEGMDPRRIFRVQFDDIKTIREYDEPILRLVEWYEREILKQTLNDAAASNQMVYLFFDEVQNLDNWAQQLKFLVDSSTVQVLITGSSALRIEMGRDSLAGRIHTLEVGVLSLTEIGALRRMETPLPYLTDNGLEPLLRKDFWMGLREHGAKNKTFRDAAFSAFSERGAYPLVHQRSEAPWSLIADQLNETVIKRVIQHDLRVGEKGRKRDPQLLEEIFRICCRYAGQTPSSSKIAQELQQSLNANIGPQRVRTYMKFLADTLLIRLIQPAEIRLKRYRSDAKICLVDHGLRASWLQEQIPVDPDTAETDEVISTQAGYLAESILGASLSSISGLDISHLPPKSKDPEIDFILAIGANRIPIEVKYRNTIKDEHLKGLNWFLDNPINRAPFGIIITKQDVNPFDGNDNIIPISLRTFMLMR